MHYSIELRDKIYVKGYGFLSFAKNMSTDTHTHTHTHTTDATKTALKRAIQKQQKQLVI